MDRLNRAARAQPLRRTLDISSGPVATFDLIALITLRTSMPVQSTDEMRWPPMESALMVGEVVGGEKLETKSELIVAFSTAVVAKVEPFLNVGGVR